MNRINTFNRLITYALIGFTIISCNNAKYSVVDDAIYFTESRGAASGKYIIDDSGINLKISPRMVKAAKTDVTAKVVVDNAALEAFNKKNGTEYLPIPKELISLSDDKVNIKKGEIAGEYIKVKVKPFTKEMNNSGNKYALALSLSDVTGTTVLKSLSSYIYEFTPVIITSVPMLNGNTPIDVVMRQKYDLTAWSIEFRVNMNKLGHGVGYMNNQAIIGAWGDDSEIYVRFGDAPIRGDLLQVKHQGSQVNTKTEFKDNTWYHIAITSNNSAMKIYVDGELDATLTLPGGKANKFNEDSFHMICSGSTWFRSDCMLSEVRIWTKEISQEQIRNNMFTVNPKTDGLEAYWKMNEGSGNNFADATGHGNKAFAKPAVLGWKDGIRSDSKN